MTAITISPVEKPFSATVAVPGSKSITNRALLLAALANGTSTLRNVLLADDTRHMLAALEALGYQVQGEGTTVRIVGGGAAIPATSAQLYCGNSGTTLRFLTAACTLGTGHYVLDGNARMRQRPAGQLVDALRALGANVDYGGHSGYPPLIVRGGLRGGLCNFSNIQSSQYVSAVLMVAPFAREAVDAHLLGDITSEPYIHMTLRMMEQFGRESSLRQGRADAGEPSYVTYVHVPNAPAEQAKPAGYVACDYNIEPDASNASYFLAAAALCPGSRVHVPGLTLTSLQGDAHFAEILGRMGARVHYYSGGVTVDAAPRLAAIDVDLNAMPDMAQTLAVLALFANGTSRITNVSNLRLKETDRLDALQQELRRFGAKVETTDHSITITPPERLTPASVHTYDDHRMAMAFSVAGLRVPGVQILDPQCVNKTFPDYFERLAAMAASVVMVPSVEMPVPPATFG